MSRMGNWSVLWKRDTMIQGVHAIPVGPLVLVLAISACGGQDSGLDTDALAYEFAPVMWFEEDEEYHPISADAFISQSQLWRTWAFGPPRNRRRPGGRGWETTEPAQSWFLDVDDEHWRMAPGEGSYGIAPYHLASYGFPNNSDQWLNPREGALGKLAEGDSLGRVIDRVNPPVYYTHQKLYGKCHVISYWFFFGYSEFVDVGIPVLGNHQGDWETLSVVVEDDSVRHAWFTSHDVYRPRNRRDGLQFDSLSGRPRVVGYFARKRHGTYWEEGSFPVMNVTDGRGNRYRTFSVPPSSRVLTRSEEIRAIIPVNALDVEALLSAQAGASVETEIGGHSYNLARVASDQTGQGTRWDSFELVRVEEQDWQEWKGRWGKDGRSPIGPTAEKRGIVYDEEMARLTSQALGNRDCLGHPDEVSR